MEGSDQSRVPPSRCKLPKATKGSCGFTNPLPAPFTQPPHLSSTLSLETCTAEEEFFFFFLIQCRLDVHWNTLIDGHF